ncbi:MAG: 23S rRNA (uracil(1939)-C(5))-methyltransferase RlmD [Sulfobacillus sp.]
MQHRVLIEDLGQHGEGVGRVDGRVVFIAGATLGDEVLVSFDPARRKMAKGELLAVITPSVDRVAPACPVAKECGGCQTMELSYPAELRWKQRRVEQTLRRLGGVEAEVEPTRPSASPLGYRHKATMPVGGLRGRIRLGYYAPFSHTLVPAEHCPVLHPDLNRTALAVQQAANQMGVAAEAATSGLRSLMARRSASTGAVQLVLTGHNLDRYPWASVLPPLLPGLAGITLAKPTESVNRLVGTSGALAWGEARISEQLLDIRFQISPLSFFQINPALAAEMALTVKQALGHVPGTLVDLYAGTGTFALTLADIAERTVAVEAVADAVADGELNARSNHRADVSFVHADAESGLKSLLAAKEPIGAVVIDPPRKGALELMAPLAAAQIPQIAYISCDVATLARDLAALGDAYRVQRVVPFDFFPRTVHVETLVLLARRR